jgi:PAS domain S-box-containing protein
LLEYTEEEIIGQPINKILSNKSGNEVVRTNDITKKLMEKPVQNVYNKYYTKSGKEIPVSFSKSFMYDDENKIIGKIYMAFHKTKEIHTEQLPIEENSRNEVKNIKTLGEIPLTNRELEVIKLIILELSNREIAEKLFISVRTVETHRKNIMQKLHAKSVISLVQYAAQNGII